MVRVRWLGHACFMIGNSKTVVMDPHDGRGIGIDPPEAKADIITISHGHFDHSDGVSLVRKPDSVIVKGSGSYEVKDVPVTGIDSHHDSSGGDKRGKNTIFIVELDGKRVCHMGDLGHPLSNEKLSEIGKVNVLMIPVGGNYTIDSREAIKICEDLDPDIVIPMHYKVPGLTLDIDDESEFISSARGKGYRIMEDIELNTDEVKGRKIVVKMRRM